jgi:hypothetical protein
LLPLLAPYFVTLYLWPCAPLLYMQLLTGILKLRLFYWIWKPWTWNMLETQIFYAEIGPLNLLYRANWLKLCRVWFVFDRYPVCVPANCWKISRKSLFMCCPKFSPVALCQSRACITQSEYIFLMQWLDIIVQFIPLFSLLLNGPDKCKHPLRAGHTDNGCDCCPVFRRNTAHIFILQNTVKHIRKYSVPTLLSLFIDRTSSGFMHTT